MLTGLELRDRGILRFRNKVFLEKISEKINTGNCRYYGTNLKVGPLAYFKHGMILADFTYHVLSAFQPTRIAWLSGRQTQSISWPLLRL